MDYEQLMEEFLSNGGQIQQIPFGVSGREDERTKRWNEIIASWNKEQEEIQMIEEYEDAQIQE